MLSRIKPVLPLKATLHHYHISVIILLLALGFRCLVFKGMASHPTRFFQKDSGGYHNLAVNLLRHGEFSRTPVENGGTLELNRTPLYPGFLAAVYAVFGIYPSAAILIQILISTVSVALTHRLGHLWGGPRIGILLAFLMSLEVSHIFYANQVMTETLFCLLLMAALIAWTLLIKRKRLIFGPITGLLFGLGALTRPVLFYFGPVAAVATLVLMKDERLRRVIAALTILTAMGLAVTPWIARNYRVTGNTMRISANQSIFIRDVVVQMRAHQQGVDHSSIREQLAREIESETSEAVRQDPGRLAAYYERKFLDEIISNWRDYAFIHLRGSLQVFIMPTANTVARALGWLRPGQGTGLLVNFANRGLADSWQAFLQFYNQLPEVEQQRMPLLMGLSAYELAFLFTVNVGMVVGTWRCLRSKRWIFLTFALTVIGYFAAATGPIGFDGRYRLPFLPCAALLAVHSVLPPAGDRRLPRLDEARTPPPADGTGPRNPASPAAVARRMQAAPIGSRANRVGVQE